MRVGVVGVGYVGLVTGLCLTQFNHDVICIDVDRKRIAKLCNGEVPIFEPGLDKILKKAVQRKKIAFSDSYSSLDCGCDVIFVCVGTPATADGRADLGPLLAAIEAIAPRLRKFAVIVIKSTVPVGTTATVAKRIRAINPSARCAVVSNPEFLREGNAVEDFMEPDRIILGADTPEPVAVMRSLYAPLLRKRVPFLLTNTATSELIKYAANGLLATKVAYINEMARLCEALGANVHDLAHGMGLDPRIGESFLRPGPGFGGSCFPKDTQALAALAQEVDCPSRIVEAVVASNAHQIRRQLRRIEAICRKSWRALGKLDSSLEGKVFALLGLAFKAQTDDVRCSPGISLAQQLAERRATVQAYDPKAMARARMVAPELDYCDSLEEALTGADCAIIATEWQQFADPSWRELRPLMDAPVVIDLRNLLRPERMRAWGFLYEPLGRPAVQLSDWDLVERIHDGGSAGTALTGSRPAGDRGTSALS